MRQGDFQHLVFKIADGSYDALTCIGVLTYVPETKGILREFARVVRKGGTLVFTQRDDLFHERELQKTIEGLIDKGIFSTAEISEPKPYLPANPDFGDEIGVIYISVSVT